VSSDDAERVQHWEYVVDTFGGRELHGWERAACPRCFDIEGHEDTKLSLGYNAATGGYNCFRCGMKGSLPHHWRSRLEEMEADPTAIKEVVRSVEAAHGYVPIFSGAGEQLPMFDPHRSYIVRPKTEKIDGVKGRGMSWETAESMRIGAASTGPLARRVIIPIPNYAEPLKPWNGWVARDWTGRAKMPYRYPSGMSREGLLFNESALWVETEEPVFVVEGVFDTTLLYPNAVSCMGKPLQSHLPKLRAARRPVVMCLDGDAWEEAWAWAMTLRHVGCRAGSIRLPPKTDPDEVPIQWLMDQAKRAL
jgi:hypothetical protein